MKMFSSKKLKEQRTALVEQMDALIGSIGEGENLTDEQRSKYNELKAKVEALDSDIKIAEDHETRQAEKSKAEFNIGQKRNTNGEAGEKKEIAKQYSVAKALRSLLPNEKIKGT